MRIVSSPAVAQQCGNGRPIPSFDQTTSSVMPDRCGGLRGIGATSEQVSNAAIRVSPALASENGAEASIKRK